MYQALSEHVTRLGHLFYLVDPRDSYTIAAEKVPHYVNDAIPYFVGILIIEQIILLARHLKPLKLNDAITSASQGILMEQTK